MFSLIRSSLVASSALGVVTLMHAQTCNTKFTPPAKGMPIEIKAAGANCNAYQNANPCDDTAIFTSAIQYIQSNGNGSGEINLPAGMACAANITISGTSNSSIAGSISIVGRGKYSSLLVPHSSAPVITISSGTNYTQGVLLENFGIETTSTQGASAGIHITGTNINDDHAFNHLLIKSNSGGLQAFTNGVLVDGRLIDAQFSDVDVEGASEDVCKFDSSASGAPIFHDSFRDMECNGSASGWGVRVNAPAAQPFHTLVFDHMVAQGNAVGGIYIDGVEEGGIYNSYLEANGSNGIYITGTYAMAFNVIGNLAWDSGTAILNNASLATGLYMGNRNAGSNGQLDLELNTTNPSSSILLGANYDSGVSSNVSGNVVQVPVAAGTITLH